MPRLDADFENAPTNRPTETLDVRELGPPKPLSRTLERLAELDDETVLIQRNDRVPQHLYPKLSDRGYVFETVEQADAGERDGRGKSGEVVVTAIWRAEP
ncbi:DUF2249 domain-containing protein [Haloparvum sedimenti]|uniref:DUF2249 domain-containing protein n=1 Tax=Haloparvum sedimenti TaxID=1678448 RepID=UPI00071E8859|nr:DUF2249 domain-containing protein [Haloparvum sedimenti]